MSDKVLFVLKIMGRAQRVENLMQINEALEILRKEFIERNKDFFEKIERSKKTGVFKCSTIKDFNQFYLRDILKIFRVSNFYSTKLLQIYEEILYLYDFFPFNDYSIKINKYYKNDNIDTDSIIKEIQHIAQIIKAKNVIEKHVKELSKEIGIKNLDIKTLDNDFSSLKQYLKAIESGKKKKLFHSGDEEFLVSKIPLNGKGFIEEEFKIDNRVFYTSKSEHIIEMARVSKPGIYIIANIPYDEYSESAFYILFVTKGDAFLIDNNIHSFRDVIKRNEDRFIERRTDNTYLPWEIIMNFLENKNEDKTVVNPKSSFSFKVIGHLSDVNPTDSLGIIAIIDTCLYTFSKTRFLKNSSVALKIDMLDTEFLKQSENNALVTYKNNIPAITDIDLNWDPDKFDLPKENSGSYLEPDIKKVPLNLKNIKRNELTSLEQTQKKLTYMTRKQVAKKLEKKLKKDYEKNWDKVKRDLTVFIQKHFLTSSEYFIKKSLMDKEYEYIKYCSFADNMKENSKPIKEKILTIKYNNNIIYGNYDRWARRKFLVMEQEDCIYCNKHHGRYEFLLKIKDFRQFVDFFELSESEIKKLPIQMKKYFNQARVLYNGNSILQDLDPISQIENPWWSEGFNYEPYIIISFSLCGFCYKKLKRRLKNDIQRKI